jgi:hypothetical protein
MRPILQYSNRLLSTISTSTRTFRSNSINRMPIATQVPTPGTGHGAKDVMNGLKDMEWVAAKDVSAEVGGQANVDYLKRVSYDFSSEPPTFAVYYIGLMRR